MRNLFNYVHESHQRTTRSSVKNNLYLGGARKKNILTIENIENGLKKIRQKIDQTKKESLEIHQQYAILISSSFEYSNVEDKENPREKNRRYDNSNSTKDVTINERIISKSLHRGENLNPSINTSVPNSVADQLDEYREKHRQRRRRADGLWIEPKRTRPSATLLVNETQNYEIPIHINRYESLPDEVPRVWPAFDQGIHDECTSYGLTRRKT